MLNYVNITSMKKVCEFAACNAPQCCINKGAETELKARTLHVKTKSEFTRAVTRMFTKT